MIMTLAACMIFQAKSMDCMRLVEKPIQKNPALSPLDNRLVAAIEANSEAKVVADLLEGGANPNCDDLLGWAASVKDVSVVKALIQGGAQVNRRTGGYTPLQCAAALARKEVVQELVEAGAEYNILGCTNETIIKVLATSVAPSEAELPDIVQTKLVFAKQYLPEQTDEELQTLIEASIKRVTSKQLTSKK